MGDQAPIKNHAVNVSVTFQEQAKRGTQVGDMAASIEKFNQADTAPNLETFPSRQLPCLKIVNQRQLGLDLLPKKYRA